MTRWDELNARARGLGTHLLTRAQLAGLAHASGLDGLAAAFRGLGFAVAEGPVGPEDLELAVRRRAARALRIVGWWAADRPGASALVFGDEDRRSVRAMLRGAAARASARQRLAGLVPTPALPERALEELARAPAPAAVVTLLTAWRHPLGPPLSRLAAVREPDLFALDQALNRAAAAQAAAAVRRDDRALRAFVRESIDLSNVLAAVTLAGRPGDVVPRDAFLPGGARVGIGAFETAAAAPNAAAAARALAPAFAGSHFAPAFAGSPSVHPAALEDALLRARIREHRAAARRHPLGPGPLLGFALRLRAETMDLHRLIWGAALGAPPLELVRDLATVA